MAHRSTFRRFDQLIAGVMLLVAAGCSDGAPKQRLSAWAAKKSAITGLAIGMDCTEGGRNSCIDPKLCVHISPDPTTAKSYVCSQYCETQLNCPAGWKCSTLFPGQPKNGICLPPVGFVPNAVTPGLAHTPTRVAELVDGGVSDGGSN